MWVVAGHECPGRTGIRQKQLALLGGALWGGLFPSSLPCFRDIPTCMSNRHCKPKPHTELTASQSSSCPPQPKEAGSSALKLQPEEDYKVKDGDIGMASHTGLRLSRKGSPF